VGNEIQSNAKFRAQMCAAECHGIKTAARFAAYCEQFKSGAAWSVAFHGQILPWELAFRNSLESGGWHSAVCLRAEIQRSQLPARFVAFRGQFKRRA
jgi:hypothetical protein